MKMKSYVLLAASGLFAVFCACAAPVFADDLSNPSDNSGMTAPADNSGMQNPSDPTSATPNTPAQQGDMNNNATPDPNANVGASDSPVGAPDSPSNDITNNPSGVDMNNSSGTNDDGTPDTATGDDDY